MSRKKSLTPTDLELDVMKVLWDKGESLTINEIAEAMNQKGSQISVASVAQVTKKLLEKRMVRVSEHKLVSNVYARTFCPILERDQYLEDEIGRLQNIISVDRSIATMGIFQTLLRHSDKEALSEEDLEQLSGMLENYRKGKH